MRRYLIGFVCAWAAAWAVTGCAGGGGTADGSGTTPPSQFLRTGAEVAVVDFFDMYCHTCQSAASHVNELHAMVQKRGLGSRVAFYAVGVNNTEMEADLYRTRFHVPFPVIADRERTIATRYGVERPPVLIALKRAGGGWKEVYRTTDPTAPPEEILARIQP